MIYLIFFENKTFNDYNFYDKNVDLRYLVITLAISDNVDTCPYSNDIGDDEEDEWH